MTGDHAATMLCQANMDRRGSEFPPPACTTVGADASISSLVTHRARTYLLFASSSVSNSGTCYRIRHRRMSCYQSDVKLSVIACGEIFMPPPQWASNSANTMWSKYMIPVYRQESGHKSGYSIAWLPANISWGSS